ncbi:hypothetical protein DKP78_18775, partial [Enterococcus faecium]
MLLHVVFAVPLQSQLKCELAPPGTHPVVAERRGGALGDHAVVPVPVLLQRVQDVLSVWVHQVSPG